jgi:hypothetical protein
MDPPGLALENFDGSGRYRTQENGVDIDASGQIDGVAFEEVSGLYDAVRNNQAVPVCLTERLYSYGSGGPLENRGLLDYLAGRFSEDGYRVPGLLRTIATSRAFSRVHLPEQPASEVALSEGPQREPLSQLALQAGGG